MAKQGVLLTLTGPEYAALRLPEGVEMHQAWEVNGLWCVKVTGEGLPGPEVDAWTVYRPGRLYADGCIEVDAIWPS